MTTETFEIAKAIMGRIEEIDKVLSVLKLDSGRFVIAERTFHSCHNTADIDTLAEVLIVALEAEKSKLLTEFQSI